MKKQNIKHKVNKMDIEANGGALEKAGIKEGDIVGIPIEDTVELEATRNTNLPDGTFIAKGQKVEVSAEYAERVRIEGNKSFK